MYTFTMHYCILVQINKLIQMYLYGQKYYNSTPLLYNTTELQLQYQQGTTTVLILYRFTNQHHYSTSAALRQYFYRMTTVLLLFWFKEYVRGGPNALIKQSPTPCILLIVVLLSNLQTVKCFILTCPMAAQHRLQVLPLLHSHGRSKVML